MMDATLTKVCHSEIRQHVHDGAQQNTQQAIPDPSGNDCVSGLEMNSLNSAQASTDQDSADDDETSSDSEDLICQTPLLRMASVRNADMLEEAILVEWKGTRQMRTISGTSPHTGKQIFVSTLLEPDDMAPLFSGAEWAGTRVWDAAVECIQYLYDQLALADSRTHKSGMCNDRDEEAEPTLLEGLSVLELGCGLGIPGMVSFMGMKAKHVVLTDQEQILKQMTQNVESNFIRGESPGRIIEARALHWSKVNVQRLLDDVGLSGQGFDYVLNCDCVYEPLYGNSWKALVECIDELLRIKPGTIVISSCERRNQDGVDRFVQAMEQSKHVKAVARVLVKGPVEIYETSGHCVLPGT
jgi:predicted nicotinamide N-methyase